MMKFENCKNEIERQIIVALVEDALVAGFIVSVNDGAESKDEAVIFAEMNSIDVDYLYLRREGMSTQWVQLVYGNGCDVMSNWTCELSDRTNVMKRAEELAKRFAG